MAIVRVAFDWLEGLEVNMLQGSVLSSFLLMIFFQFCLRIDNGRCVKWDFVCCLFSLGG